MIEAEAVNIIMAFQWTSEIVHGGSFLILNKFRDSKEHFSAFNNYFLGICPGTVVHTYTQTHTQSYTYTNKWKHIKNKETTWFLADKWFPLSSKMCCSIYLCHVDNPDCHHSLIHIHINTITGYCNKIWRQGHTLTYTPTSTLTFNHELEKLNIHGRLRIDNGHWCTRKGHFVLSPRSLDIQESPSSSH